MDYTSLDHEHRASLQLDDEGNALYLGVPLLSKSNPPKEQRPKPPRSSATKKCSYWATFTIATVQLLMFIAIIYKYGFASVHSNPFLGPSFDDLDEWCSKNPTKILESGEYWRIVTSMFCNAGMLDLLISTFVLFGLGHHLEERWGSFRFLFTYIVSGEIWESFNDLYTSHQRPSLSYHGTFFFTLCQALEEISSVQCPSSRV